MGKRGDNQQPPDQPKEKTQATPYDRMREFDPVQREIDRRDAARDTSIAGQQKEIKNKRNQ